MCTGVIGPQREALAAGMGGLWLGESHDAESILAAAPTTSVVVCSGGVSPTLINSVIREERLGGREPVFHPGSWGIDARRVKASPVSNEAFLYVESGSLSRTDLGLKRIFDIVVSASLLLIAAAAVCRDRRAHHVPDDDPDFFRQRRVGRDDRGFEMLKFRTMVVDAEVRLAELDLDNQRSGPLFKLAVDPRVTTIGRSSARRAWTSCHS